MIEPGLSPRRILILGAPGAGKSTLAGKLESLLGIPAYHLQALFWRPGWRPTPPAEWDAVVGELVGRDEWIIEGNNVRTLPLRLAAAETVIFLDFPRLICLFRVVKRRALLALRPPLDLAPGSRTQFDLQLLRWVWSFPSEDRPVILSALNEAAAEREVVVLRTPKDVGQFVFALSSRAAFAR